MRFACFGTPKRVGYHLQKRVKKMVGPQKGGIPPSKKSTKTKIVLELTPTTIQYPTPQNDLVSHPKNDLVSHPPEKVR